MRKLINKLRQRSYYIGFYENLDCISNFKYDQVKWLDLNGYSEGWFADPFLIEVTDKSIKLLAEEWNYNLGHGRISLLEVAKNGYKLISVKPILELQTHLSFPYPFEFNGKSYICPENYQSGKSIVYEYDRLNHKILQNQIVLVEKPLLDVQIFEHNGNWYLTGVEYRTGEQEDTRTLLIYKADTPFGPFKHIDTETAESCTNRGAGLVYKIDNKIFRPSQCCENGQYGTAVILKEIELKNNKLSQTEIGRISSIRNKRNGLVLHTFNQMDEITVIDGNDYNYGKIGRFTEWAIKTFKKLIGR